MVTNEEAAGEGERPRQLCDSRTNRAWQDPAKSKMDRLKWITVVVLDIPVHLMMHPVATGMGSYICTAHAKCM
ncbi:hypothetical protein XELAEV_18014910mg [Xenopus laevis]|uniref:Uncharacterized protein n=1 Tax=Xenopus laevis TaxID=8355 RepID=A0A974DH12_XENLA|nr:hypothetical protein XELAEV_18014910mg [Xenopus laevis]